MASPSLFAFSNWPEKTAHHNATAINNTNNKDNGINNNIESSIIIPLDWLRVGQLKLIVGDTSATNYKQLIEKITALISLLPKGRPVL